MGSFEGRVLVSARMFKELGASTREEIDTLEIVDQFTRPVSDGNEAGIGEWANRGEKKKFLR